MPPGRALLVATLACLLAPALAGCLRAETPGASGEGGEGAAGARALQAPWWNVGESWTIRFETADGPGRTVTMVNFANNSFGDPAHFWLGVRDRQEALDHVFFETNPFLGRIHWEILAPHEKGMHSAMYSWPLEDGATWSSPLLFGKRDLVVDARARPDGTFAVEGVARADGSTFAYDYDPSLRWFRELSITEEDGAPYLHATVTSHREAGEKGTFYFLRGRDYLDADGGSTGEEETFTVEEEGATSIAFLLDVRTSGVASLEFIDPSGNVFHRETLPVGGASDKVVEVAKKPAPGEWKLRYVGSATGQILVRGIIEYKATL